ncbi:unnamed protein product [Paramecium primaurelia]|uniref:Uncharacterized protein n=1 Tax=Paramecium primaurelia TaxID=5886 RepID=A0A8S1QEJ2_PARPR|nr:unnamed protein product [Paramecium primaurelia]
MINSSQLYLKREQFFIQIRKQAREEIFSRKRHTNLSSDLNGELKCLPDELIVQIYKSFMVKDFQTLRSLLFKYNEQLLLIIVKQQQGDEVMMNQYINHFSINQDATQLFMQILRMSDVQLDSNIEEIRVKCLNLVIIILINLTYGNTPQIINNLLNHNFLDIIFNDLLGRMNSKQKLAQNYDEWQLIIESLSQLLINLLLDLKDERGVQIKIEIMKSSFLNIWHYVYREFPPQILWSSMLFLQQMIFFNPSIPDTEIVSLSFQRILQQCDYVITELSEQTQLYEAALILINYCSKHQLETTIILTKPVWVKILLINKFPLVMYSTFINLTSKQYDEDSPISNLNVEKQLLENGILNNMLSWLQNSPDEQLIIKIYKCLNNILIYQYQHLASVVISHFLPFLDLYFEGITYYQEEIVNEYLILLKNLIIFQKLNDKNIIQILEEYNIFKQIKEILLQGCFQTWLIMNLFEAFDLLSIQFKLLILNKMVQYQIVETFHLFISRNDISQDFIETLQEYIENWQSEIYELNNQ